MALPIIGKTVICSGCGEAVQRAARCSNCGVRIKNPALPFILFLVVLVCAVMVSRAVRSREPKRIKISEIKPYMNFRKVRVEGLLIEPAKELKSGALFYVVHDGSGQLPVFAAASPMHRCHGREQGSVLKAVCVSEWEMPGACRLHL